jgi:single-stranded DNA-binding protein
MSQIFSCVIQGTVVGRPESGHISSSGRAFVKFSIVHRTGYFDRKNNKWVPTAPMTFEVTCWDEQLILRARTFKSGNEILVEVKKFVPYLDRNGDETVMNINPTNVLLVSDGAPTSGDTGRRQRSGDLVVSPHGEKIAADAWPEAVTDLSMVHHR